MTSSTEEKSNSKLPSNPSSSSQDAEAAQLSKKEDAYPADAFSLPRRILFIASVCMSMFINQLGLCNTLTTLSIIGDSFRISNPGTLSWFIAGYSLTIGTFILIGGRLGDEFGNKKMFSMVAGLSVYSNHMLYVFARVFQGMGPALTLPNALGIFSKSFSEGLQNMAFAWFAASAPFSAMAFSQAIAIALVAAFAAWTIPGLSLQEEERNLTMSQKLDRLDLSKGATGVMALVLFNFAEPYVYMCLILSFIFSALFFYIEIRQARHPILPISAFTVDITFIFACTAAGWATFSIWLLYVVQVCLNIGEQTPIQLAAWFTPILITGVASALTVGKIINRVPAVYIMAVRQVAFLTYFFFTTIIATIRMDTSLPAAIMIFSSTVAREYQGMGTSIVMTLVNYSISLRLGFASTIETNINNDRQTKADLLHGYQGALWFSVGLTGLRTVLSLIYLFKTQFRPKSDGDH
ncbi:MFS general substrate transporter [Trichoderma citrinoviride]|uniref:MFS general substrate transporter n=1 Tax=Trichoderma citrinoviride TaxID=58853 RepID=A0A2T4B103_9HYPO|nr:MFS general substrate transporter [Trichoderma citrinoviride]PTB62999.1 MFS general substrate transporter [Trichoderma citrinoviride]